MLRGLKKSYQAVLGLLILPFFLACNPLLNFGVVSPNAIYRSGQPDKDDLKYILKKGKIRTILNLKLSVDRAEQKWADRYGVNIIQMRMHADNPPTEDELNQYFNILLNPNTYPLWIHCQGGADRTGILVAIYRMEFENWSKWRAIGEMLTYFHIPFTHPKLTTYLYHYKRRFGRYEESREEMGKLQKYLQEKKLLQDQLG